MAVAASILFPCEAHRVAVGFALLLALCAAASAQHTRPSDATERRIARLLFDLDAPDPYLRDRVTEELIRIGPDAIEPLNQALKDPPSPEFETRARLILAEIPRRWKHIRPEGGPVTAGFQAVLRAPDGPCRAGEDLYLNLEIAAVGLGRAAIRDLRAVDVELSGQEPATSPLAEARLVIRRIGEAAKSPRPAPLVFDRGPRRTIDLEPGGAIRIALPIHDSCELPSGEYEMQVIYHAGTRSLVPGATRELASNVVRVSVRP